MTEEQAEYRLWQGQQIVPKLKELGEIIAARQDNDKSCPNEVILADAVIDYIAAIQREETPH